MTYTHTHIHTKRNIVNIVNLSTINKQDFTPKTEQKYLTDREID